MSMYEVIGVSDSRELERQAYVGCLTWVLGSNWPSHRGALQEEGRRSESQKVIR